MSAVVINGGDWHNAMNESPLDRSVRRALLVVAHGSPRPTANTDLYRILDVCRKRETFYRVQKAFLECNAPSIPEGIAICAAENVSEIVLVPYFLHTGKHVADDLPTVLEAGQRRHPGITFRLSSFIGRSSYITEILEKRLQEALETLANEVG